MDIVVRTHGGLGNQIFQLFYARLFAVAHRANLFEVHDKRYAHGFERSRELELASVPLLAGRIISSIRIPKIATRAGKPIDAIRLFQTTYLDGYFQHVDDYSGFSDEDLHEQLRRLRFELGVASPCSGTKAIHLRLGDFFASEADLTAHLDHRLKQIDPGVSIVTNEEDRLATPAVAATLASAGARIVPTGDMTPEQVLRTLAGFAEVDGNDSTLLFWASVLSGTKCAFRNPELRALRARFLQSLDH